MGNGYDQPSWRDGARDSAAGDNAGGFSARAARSGSGVGTRWGPGGVDLDGEVWEAELVDEPWDPAYAYTADDVEIVDPDALEAIVGRGSAGATAEPTAAASLPGLGTGLGGPTGSTGLMGVKTPPTAAGSVEPGRSAGLADPLGSALAGADPASGPSPVPSGSAAAGRVVSAGARRRRSGGRQMAWGWVDRLFRRRMGPLPLVVVAGAVVLALLIGGLSIVAAGRDADTDGGGGRGPGAGPGGVAAPGVAGSADDGGASDPGDLDGAAMADGSVPGAGAGPADGGGGAGGAAAAPGGTAGPSAATAEEQAALVPAPASGQPVAVAGPGSDDGSDGTSGSGGGTQPSAGPSAAPAPSASPTCYRANFFTAVVLGFSDVPTC
ncbi:hypothetical protein [Pseudofrankia sp. BMG5.36]|uniref:hypothetical protein n=1 Tax=Pseudofrankia sp. BMG5.36 TaxID=1834512 RepID=UPI0008D94386|nr:hypothetical protein [Pseudofrankia sp. BMG5.36]OHV47158.1 hypothetical protein BCD48_19905 [Pseudofrankia sp. BMG5.36]